MAKARCGVRRSHYKRLAEHTVLQSHHWRKALLTRMTPQQGGSAFLSEAPAWSFVCSASPAASACKQRSGLHMGQSSMEKCGGVLGANSVARARASVQPILSVTLAAELEPTAKLTVELVLGYPTNQRRFHACSNSLTVLTSAQIH